MSMSLFSFVLAGATAQAAEDALPTPKPMVLMQTWATLLDQDQDVIADPGGYGDPEDDPGFKLRRVRLGFEGRSDEVMYGVSVGLSAPYDVVEEAQGHEVDLGLVDAYGGYAPTEGLWIVGGVQKVPVSREALMAASDLTFTERAVSTAWLTPGRDIGALIDGRWNDVRIRVGGFNGSGTLVGDNNAGKLVAIRAEYKTGPGEVYQTHGAVDSFTVGVAVDGWMNEEPAISSNGFGADLIVRFSGFTLLAEGRRNRAAPKEDLVIVPGVFDETKRQGVMTQVGYSIGSFEPAVRYSVMDDDLSMEDSGDVSEVLGGVTWHSEKEQFRAGAGYVVRNENGGNIVPNDTLRAWVQLKL